MSNSPRRYRFAWLALVALLSNALLPAVLVVALAGPRGDRDTFQPGLCGASPGRDVPGKAKPALLAHHCALCTVAADVLTPPRQASAGFPPTVAGAAFLVRPTTALSPPFRNYRTQPRAPPATT